MKTRIIHTKIHFEDDWFSTLPIGLRYIFIYLFTNSHIGQTGIYRLSKRVALLETGATVQEWDEACQRFEADKKIRFIDDWIVVLNASKHASYSGGKNEIAYKKELESLPKHIRDTVSIPYLYPMHTTINHKSEIINKKSETENHNSNGYLKALEVRKRLGLIKTLPQS
jgi:hypothetical protein